jgi:competence protein ComFC
MLKQILQDTVQFIFPPVCIISDKRLPEGNSNKYILDDILTSLDRITDFDFDDLKAKIDSEDAFSIYTFYPDSQMEKIVHHIKYSGMKNLGTFKGELIAQEMKFDPSAYDFIIPVPLHKVRIRERHYNQSEYIAKGISKKLGTEVLSDAVSRIRYTKTQTHLTRAERIENVKGAFIINDEFREMLKGKNIILVDDVVTTGSTVNEVIRILKENGAGNILTICLAMARD